MTATGPVLLLQVSGRDQVMEPYRRLRLRIAATWPWATQITAAITRLQTFAPG